MSGKLGRLSLCGVGRCACSPGWRAFWPPSVFFGSGAGDGDKTKMGSLKKIYRIRFQSFTIVEAITIVKQYSRNDAMENI